MTAERKPVRRPRPRKRTALLFPRPGVRRRLGALFVGLIAAALGIVVGLMVFDRLVMPQVVRHGQDVRVPQVAGRDLQQAESILRSSGLEPVRGPGQYHFQVPRGAVLEVSPPAGLAVKRGRQVFLTPSLGPITHRVPLIVGMSTRLARVKLSEASLSIGRIDHAATDLVPADQVLAATPDAGSPAPESGQVDVLVSRPRASTPYWMPDLRGRDGRESSAWLQAAGLLVDSQDTAYGDVVVVGQEPGAGSPVWPGMQVRLHMGSGRPRTGMLRRSSRW